MNSRLPPRYQQRRPYARDTFPTYRGNYGAGIGKIWTWGKKIFDKNKHKLRPIVDKGLDKAFDKGKDYYAKHKGEVKKIINDKANDVVKQVLVKVEKDMPNGKLKNHILDNSDLVSSVSNKLLDKAFKSGENFTDGMFSKIESKAKSKIDDLLTEGSGPKRGKRKVKGAGLMIL